jgi:hypothetical protein
MTNYTTSINPIKKVAKCWVYDISEGAIVSAGTKFSTPIDEKKQY